MPELALELEPELELEPALVPERMSMKARHIKPGATIDGWTVVSIERPPLVCATCGGDLYSWWVSTLILTRQERKGSAPHTIAGYTSGWVETRQAWYRADEEVEVER